MYDGGFVGLCVVAVCVICSPVSYATTAHKRGDFASLFIGIGGFKKKKNAAHLSRRHNENKVSEMISMH